MLKTLKMITALTAISSIGSATYADEAVKPEADAAETTATEADTSLAAAVFTGDIAKGKKVFKKCKACHSVKAGKNGAGPSLKGIIGAQAASVEGFKYSKAMKESGLIWDAANLAAFMKKPKELVKGTNMSFGGLKKEADIENLLAYLADATK